MTNARYKNTDIIDIMTGLHVTRTRKSVTMVTLPPLTVYTSTSGTAGSLLW